MSKNTLAFLIIYSIVILFYYPVLTTFFSHDDFFHLKVSITDGSLKQFINFFDFHPFEERLIAFYRPIFREVFYNTFYNLFGLNQLPFRILSFVLHFANIYLVFTLTEKLFRNKFISYFATFFFAITAANTASFYYLAGGIQTQGATMFILSTLIFYIKYLENKKSAFKYFAFSTFLLAISSHEQAAILPLLLIGIIFTKFNLRTSFKRIPELLPLFLVIALYVYVIVYIIGYSSGETQYQMSYNIKTAIQTISWYTVWALGMPETFVDYLLPGFGLNPNLMKYWGNYYRFIFPAFFYSIFTIVLSSIIILFKKYKVLIDKGFLFYILWFPLGILPVLFLPTHKSTHYLYPSLPAFWTLIAYVVYNAFNILQSKQKALARALLTSTAVVLFILSATSVLLGKTTYWAAARGRYAGKLINNIKEKYPTLPKGSVIYYENDSNYPFVSEDWGSTSKQAYYALNGNDAIRLLYDDRSINVYYQDLDSPPEDISENKVYTLKAVIP